MDMLSVINGFGVPMKTPFSSVPAKVLVKSKYAPTIGSTGTSTLAGTVVNTVLLLLDDAKNKKNHFAVGEVDGKTVVEYHRDASSKAHNIVDIMCYNPEEGTFLGICYDEDKCSQEQYVLAKGKRDGKIMLAAMWPTFMSDPEFLSCFDMLKDGYQADGTFADMFYAIENMGRLCDNVYRRLKDESCPAAIIFDVPETGTIPKMKNSSIIDNIYAPETIISGEFIILDSSAAAAAPVTGVTSTKKCKTSKDLAGKFIIDPARKFTQEEEDLIPQLEDWYLPQDVDFEVCEDIVKTSTLPMPFRNFVFRGGAGSGKSAKSRAIAAGLNLPYGFYTCSANTEIFDLVGQVMPATQNDQDPCAKKLFEQFEALGGVNFDSMVKVLGLRSIDDCEFAPGEVYQELTGNEFTPEGTEPTTSDASKAWCQYMMKKFDEVLNLISGTSGNEAPKFIYTETPFIKAIKNGWVFEIQEPNVIASEGVIVGLNGLLQEGRIVLPTGEVVTRHPDSVIIFTTNVSYNGCRDMNQSVIDRGSEVFDIETPEVESMAKRAMAVTGYEDESKALEMAKVVSDIQKTMNESGIDDGVCGMRSLISWMTKAAIGCDVYKSALTTVIAKTSSDPEARGSLLKRLDESSFKKISRRRRR